MTSNIIFALILPWIVGVFLLKKDFKIFLFIAPIATVVAMTFDVLGFQLKFWRIDPEYDIETFAALPMYFGVYPILTAYLFYFIKRTNKSHLLWIIIFTMLTTLIEYTGVKLEMVHYFNAWTIGWTFVSYLLAYIFCYGYFLLLKKYVDV